MKRSLLFLPGLLLLFLPFFLSGQNPVTVGSITIDNGLPHSDANALLRDEKGMIWIGTYSGLTRYDGYEAKRYYCSLNPATGAYDNRIADMWLEDGMIWMATDGGVQCFDIRTGCYRAVRPASEPEALHRIGSGDGFVYAVTVKNSLCVFRQTESGVLETVPMDLPETVHFRYLCQGNSPGEWLISSDRGVWKIQPGSRNLRSLPVFDPSGKELSDIQYVGLDSDKNLVFSDDSHFYRSVEVYHSESDKVHTLAIPLKNAGAQVTGVVQLPDRTYWVSTHNGLAVLSPRENQPWDVRYINTVDHTPKITSDYVNALLYDPSGVLFLASYGQGVTLINLQNKQFHTLQQGRNPGLDLPENIVRAIVEDGAKIWIGTNSKGVVCYDTEHRSTVALESFATLKSRSVRALELESGRYLWVATEQGVDVVDLERRVVSPYTDQLPHKEVSTLAIDCFGQVWAGGWYDGLHCIRLKPDGQFDVFSLSASVGLNAGDFDSNRIYAIYTSPEEPLIYFSTEKKLYRIDLDPQGAIRQIRECVDSKDQPNSTTYFICSIDRQDDATLWVGTIGNGAKRLRFVDETRYEAEHFDETAGFPFRDVESLLIDRQGMVWCAGNGLVKLDPFSRDVRLYNVDDGLTGHSFKVGSRFRGAGNRLYFGGINGITYFNPEEIQSNDVLPTPVFSKLTVNNREVEPGDSDRPVLTRNISYTDRIRLYHNQNHFALHFSPAHYTNPDKCRFRYRIDRVDPAWVYLPTGSHTAFFSNLPYGSYTILLQTSNNDEIWSDRTSMLTVTVLPPWWWTVWAKLFYCLVVLSAVFLILRYAFRSIRLNNRLRIKEIEEQKSEQLREFQSRFFTNISHELRTPITLILGEVEQLQEEKQTGGRARLDILNRNTRRLLSLVNELMDFRKIESEGMPLHVHPFRLNGFLEEIAAEFRSVASLQAIDYRVDVAGEEPEGYFDPEVVEKIVLNILNNAFKYTPNGGCIRLERIRSGEEWQPVYHHTYRIESPYPVQELHWMRLTDTGIGISEESLPAIFDRYYQIHDTELDPHLGSGVGLALVKSLVQLHRGAIRISSERKKGTEFMIGLPSLPELASEPLKDSGGLEVHAGHNRNLPVFMDVHDLPDHPEQPEIPETPGKETRYSLLVVEDHEDLLTFLKEELKPFYRIRTARNGEEAWEKVEAEAPDLIVSDWMMPVLDGIRLCHRLKNDTRYAHIPLILLTAKDSIDSQVEGMTSGADAYFAKPFSLKLLLRTIDTFLRQRERIKSYVADHYLTERAASTRSQGQDKFMARFIAVVEKHMGNPELSIDDICRLMSTSRTRLYKHVHACCQRSIMDMVRYLRLNKAIQWMAETEMSLQEIMLLVGIQSQSYFSRAFKAEFGLTPSKYLESVIRCRER